MKYITTICASHSTPRCLLKRNRAYVQRLVHNCSQHFVHKSPKAKTYACLPMNGYTDYLSRGVLLKSQKEQ